jgi:uncharacterized protein (DUF2147 family)
MPGEMMAIDRILIAVMVAAIGAASHNLSRTNPALAGDLDSASGVRIAQAAAGKGASSAPAKNTDRNARTARGTDGRAVGSTDASDITGVWLTDDGLGAVEIQPCGEARCGRVVWMKNPLDAAGRPQKDVNNPDENLQSRPICGAEIITGLVRQRDRSWDSGTIYDPKDGDDHDLAAMLKGPDELQITGYEGTKWLSQSFVWKRAPAGLGRCDQMQARAID